MPKHAPSPALDFSLPIRSLAPLPAENRRRDPRYLLRLAITLQGDNNFYSGLSEDLSEGGVFIATAHILPIGTSVMLSFTLPELNAPVALVGTVRWVRGPEATARVDNMFGGERGLGQPVPGMGIQFNDVPDGSAEAIRSFMRRRQPDFFDS